MNERNNLIPVTENEVREHYGRIIEAALLNDGGGLFDAVEAWVQLRQSQFVDPRIARIESYVQIYVKGEGARNWIPGMLAILRGEK